MTMGIAACGPSTPPPCEDDSQCTEAAPICVQIAPDEPGVCAASCTGGDCGSDRVCRDGACIACLGSDRPIGELCACDSDCSSGACGGEGRCVGECLVDGCSDGMVCEGNPAACRTCLELSGVPEGSVCGCNADCADGLECIGEFCGRSCDLDEQCGADECFHALRVPPSCGPIDPACTWSGDVRLGGTCACNADCDFDAPLCALVVIEGALTRTCTQVCGPEQPCAGGTSCCTQDGLHFYCIDPTAASTIGADCS